MYDQTIWLHFCNNHLARQFSEQLRLSIVKLCRNVRHRVRTHLYTIKIAVSQRENSFPVGVMQESDKDLAENAMCGPARARAHVCMCV